MKTILYDHPRALALAVILVAVAGVAALLTMPQAEDPKIRNRNAVILTALPGASAERVERLVSQVIEDELRGLEEVDIVSSTSSTGLSSVSVTLQDAINETDQAFSKVRDALADAAVLLPEGASDPRFIDERGYAFTLLAAIVWEGEEAPDPLILKRTAEELEARLRNVPGTEYVLTEGVGDEEISVTLDPDLAASLSLGEAEIARAIAQADAKQSAGQVYGQGNELAVEVRGELTDLTRLRAVPLRRGRDGAQLLLGDVARISRGIVQPEPQGVLVNGKRAVVVGTRIDDGLRVGGWSARVREELDAFEAELSAGLELELIFDQSVYAEERFGSLLVNLFVGIMLVVAILFFTLGFRSALLVTAAIPLTSLLSLAVMNFVGIPIHQMSITGLIVALGLLVDAAIVMCDAVSRALTRGLSPREAVEESVGRLWLPLLSSTLTTVLAFMPITLLIGGAGEFVGPIADSVIIALIASFLLAVSVIAALAGFFLRPEKPAAEGGRDLFAPIGKAFEGALAASLARPRLSIALALVLPVLGFVGAGRLPNQFFPDADRAQFHVQLELHPQASLEETERAVAAASAVLDAHEEIVQADWFTGSSVPAFYYNLKMNRDGAKHFAEAMVTARELSGLETLVNDLQAELTAAVPNAQVNTRLLVQGPPTNAPFELRISGPNLDELRRLGEEARLILSEMPEVTVSSASLSGGEPKIWVEADEEAALIAGMPLAAVSQAIAAKLQGARGGSVIEGQNEIPVVVRLGDARGSIEELRSATLVAPSGAGVPLASLGELTLQPSAAKITRYDGERVNNVFGFMEAGALPAVAITRFEEAMAEGRFQLPYGYDYAFGGDAEARSDAVGALLASVGLIVTLVVAVVVLTFGSFRLGALILTVAGLSMGLGMLSLTLAGFAFGFQPIIALMGLMGVAINAAIIIVTTLREDVAASRGEPEAVREGVLKTARHITSTTLTTFAGFLPLILSEGGFWPPFATAIAGGVVLSTVVSFFFVPQAFLLLARGQERRASSRSLPQGGLAHA
ncbi:efflux RND transporter permease subunit [Parvularcula maris]|uniref:Efflux RND transporter permease subunit n=1 Tax=Parvularcula maris TaxID=2965077 RepID=A0A9X2LAL6_9PROT|nr:efflux RND transporter permease subunit [Parvularcula maris]MCQ8185964.1 efflux RND transporter permease subunit [Parvularcula maris]